MICLMATSSRSLVHFVCSPPDTQLTHVDKVFFIYMRMSLEANAGVRACVCVFLGCFELGFCEMCHEPENFSVRLQVCKAPCQTATHSHKHYNQNDANTVKYITHKQFTVNNLRIVAENFLFSHTYTRSKTKH